MRSFGFSATLLLTVAANLAGALPQQAPPTPAPSSDDGPSFRSSASADAPAEWIVQLKKSVPAQKLMSAGSVDDVSSMHNNPNGYVIKTNDQKFIQSLQSRDEVDFVEMNGVMTAYNMDITSKPAVTWGQERINARLPSEMNNQYSYPKTGGANVTVYMIDSGIERAHPEFADRVVNVTSFVSGSNGDDDNGHGTHCSGTVAGKNVGIAPLANLVGVKVLDKTGSGSFVTVAQGIDWARNDAKRRGGPAIISMSLGGGASQLVDSAVNRAIADGMMVVVAAGNDGKDACDYSPSRVDGAITVGATGYSASSGDFVPYWSNTGKCVDIFGPGKNVNSSVPNNQYQQYSGTSMATPHVAGVAALFWSANPEMSASEIYEMMFRLSSPIPLSLDRSGFSGTDAQFKDMSQRLKNETRTNFLFNQEGPNMAIGGRRARR